MINKQLIKREGIFLLSVISTFFKKNNEIREMVISFTVVVYVKNCKIIISNLKASLSLYHCINDQKLVAVLTAQGLGNNLLTLNL